MHVVIAGGSGFLGRALTAALVARGDDVAILTRGARPVAERGRRVVWDGVTAGDWAGELDAADAVVNLTGESIDARPTRGNVERLTASRVQPIAALRDAAATCAAPPRTWVQIAAVGIFGDGGDDWLDEDTPPAESGPPELVGLCRRWEAAFADAAPVVDRPVLLRHGAVIGGGDRLTATLARLVRLGLGGRAGSGRQWLSWVALDDAVAVLTRAIDDTTMRGTYHVVSPHPVTNAEMMATLRRLLGQRFGPPAPALAVKLGAWLKGSSPNLVLPSQRVRPARLLADGYQFVGADFEPVARDALAAAGYTPRA